MILDHWENEALLRLERSEIVWSFIFVPSTQPFFGVSSECLNCLRVTQGNSEQPKGTVTRNTHHLKAELIFYVCRSLVFLFRKTVLT